ncbi:FMN-binding negative transcriptional regulator [Occallatibacter riparius]|uniref:FMN-binding negative transcriptional regulator n=1 Tax=Occallatibacter riparius TaxID=1002689 RepID=A0A9J7BLI2_9BACT|nr:FMN-binding negative transcriptional regulator [Occallatibacter riparius]UWZ83321.1 FMN-binding negative transcriptional regulator [Occallatibacter riparius]
MYTPKFNQIADRATLLETMRSYPFAILFGAETATHLPLLVKDGGEHGMLEGHFAHANHHWQALAGRETLVVFPGPHTYVSPSLYVEELSVPTWNYIAIHAYGTLELIEDHDGKQHLVEELIAANEPRYLPRWQAFADGYKRTMLTGIMGFRIPIARIEGKFKISQNRPEQDRVNVRNAQAAGSDDQRELARWMDRFGLTQNGNRGNATPESRNQ